MGGVTYDTGALAAGERNDRRMWALHVVDVTVVEGAICRRDAIVTSNEDHIRRVGDAARVRLRIERI